MEGWSASAVAKVSAMMASMQPNALAFQGPTGTEVRTGAEDVSRWSKRSAALSVLGT